MLSHISLITPTFFVKVTSCAYKNTRKSFSSLFLLSLINNSFKLFVKSLLCDDFLLEMLSELIYFSLLHYVIEGSHIVHNEEGMQTKKVSEGYSFN